MTQKLQHVVSDFYLIGNELFCFNSDILISEPNLTVYRCEVTSSDFSGHWMRHLNQIFCNGLPVGKVTEVIQGMKALKPLKRTYAEIPDQQVDIPEELPSKVIAYKPAEVKSFSRVTINYELIGKLQEDESYKLVNGKVFLQGKYVGELYKLAEEKPVPAQARGWDEVSEKLSSEFEDRQRANFLAIRHKRAEELKAKKKADGCQRYSKKMCAVLSEEL